MERIHNTDIENFNTLSNEFIENKSNLAGIIETKSTIENYYKNDKEFIINLENNIISLNKENEILISENKNINKELTYFIDKSNE